MRRLRRLVFLIFTTLAAGYLGLVALAWALQGRLIFPVPPPQALEPRWLEGLSLVRPEGGAFVALHAPAPAGAPTAVFFHGNGEQLADTIELARAFQREGLGFFAIEYPGYGLAPGVPSERSIYAAAEAGLQDLRARLGVAPERTLLFGFSLGTGVAVEMARRGHGARLVLVSAFTSIADLGADAFRWLPVRLLARHRFESDEKAPGIRLPVLMIHGADDDIVPVRAGRRLAALFPRATLHEVPGADHGVLGAYQTKIVGCAARFARGEECGPLAPFSRR